MLLAKPSRLKKSLALYLLSLFILQQNPISAYAESIKPSNPDSSAGFSELPGFDTFKLPRDLGTIEEIYIAGSGSLGTDLENFNSTNPEPQSPNPTIILIQDAHAVGEAQKSILKISEYLSKNYGVSLFALEGASQPLDSFFLRSFPEPQKLKTILMSYVLRGEISGAAADAFLNSKEVRMIGIENQQLYEEGIDAFLNAQQVYEKNQAQFEALRKEIESEKEKTYSPQLLQIDREIQSLENPKNLMETLQALKSQAAEAWDPKTYTHLNSLFQEMISQQGAAAESLVKELEIKVFRKMMRPDELTALNRQRQDYQTEKISLTTYIAALTAAAAKYDVPVPEALLKRADENSQRQQISGNALWQEVETFSMRVKERFFKNPQERAIDRRDQDLKRLEKLAQLKLSRKEWEGFKGSGSGVQGAENALHPGSLTLAPFVQFYENAEAREKALHDNLLKEARKNKTDRAVFVAGGFHTEGLLENFKKENISYILISPAMKNTEENHYADFMRGQVSWKNYFKAENGRVDLAAAFNRAVRDQLLNTDPAQIGNADPRGPALDLRTRSALDRRMLKPWRDTIIRSLASKNQIAQASQYTKYLDEKITQNNDLAYKEQIKKQWLEKVERFAKGLEQLEKEGHYDVPHLYQLLGQRPPASNILSWNAIPAGSVPENWIQGNASASLRSEARAGLNLVMKPDFWAEFTEINNQLFMKKKDSALNEKKIRKEIQFLEGEFKKYQLGSFVEIDVLRDKAVKTKDDLQRISDVLNRAKKINRGLKDKKIEKEHSYREEMQGEVDLFRKDLGVLHEVWKDHDLENEIKRLEKMIRVVEPRAEARAQNPPRRHRAPTFLLIRKIQQAVLVPTLFSVGFMLGSKIKTQRRASSSTQGQKRKTKKAKKENLKISQWFFSKTPYLWDKPKKFPSISEIQQAIGELVYDETRGLKRHDESVFNQFIAADLQPIEVPFLEIAEEINNLIHSKNYSYQKLLNKVEQAFRNNPNNEENYSEYNYFYFVSIPVAQLLDRILIPALQDRVQIKKQASRAEARISKMDEEMIDLENELAAMRHTSHRTETTADLEHEFDLLEKIIRDINRLNGNVLYQGQKSFLTRLSLEAEELHDQLEGSLHHALGIPETRSEVRAAEMEPLMNRINKSLAKIQQALDHIDNLITKDSPYWNVWREGGSNLRDTVIFPLQNMGDSLQQSKPIHENDRKNLGHEKARTKNLLDMIQPRGRSSEAAKRRTQAIRNALQIIYDELSGIENDIPERVSSKLRKELISPPDFSIKKISKNQTVDFGNVLGIPVSLTYYKRILIPYKNGDLSPEWGAVVGIGAPENTALKIEYLLDKTKFDFEKANTNAVWEVGASRRSKDVLYVLPMGTMIHKVITDYLDKDLEIEGFQNGDNDLAIGVLPYRAEVRPASPSPSKAERRRNENEPEFWKPLRSSASLARQGVERAEVREVYKTTPDLLNFLEKNWQQIQKNGAFIFDMQKTLTARREKASPEIIAGLIWLLDQGIRVVINSGNTKKEVFDQVINGMRAELEKQGKTALLNKVTVYANSGTLKVTFDKKGNEVEHPEYSEKLKLSNQLAPAIAHVLKELAKKNFLITEDAAMKKLQGMYQKDAEKSKGKISFKLWEPGKPFQPSVVNFEEMAGEISGPHIQRRGLTQDNFPTALAVAKFHPDTRTQIIEWLKKGIAQQLGQESVNALNIASGGESTIDITSKDANKALAIVDFVNSQPADWPVDPQFMGFFGDELTLKVTGEKTGEDHPGNDSIVMNYPYVDSKFKNIFGIAVSPKEPYWLKNENASRIYYVHGPVPEQIEQKATEWFFDLWIKRMAPRAEVRSEKTQIWNFLLTQAQNKFLKKSVLINQFRTSHFRAIDIENLLRQSIEPELHKAQLYLLRISTPEEEWLRVVTQSQLELQKKLTAKVPGLRFSEDFIKVQQPFIAAMGDLTDDLKYKADLLAILIENENLSTQRNSRNFLEELEQRFRIELRRHPQWADSVEKKPVILSQENEEIVLPEHLKDSVFVLAQPSRAIPEQTRQLYENYLKRTLGRTKNTPNNLGLQVEYLTLRDDLQRRLKRSPKPDIIASEFQGRALTRDPEIVWVRGNLLSVNQLHFKKVLEHRFSKALVKGETRSEVRQSAQQSFIESGRADRLREALKAALEDTEHPVQNIQIDPGIRYRVADYRKQWNGAVLNIPEMLASEITTVIEQQNIFSDYALEKQNGQLTVHLLRSESPTRSEARQQDLDETPFDFISARGLTRVQQRSVVSRQMEAGIPEHILDRIREKFGDPIAKRVAQVIFTGGLGALMHDLIPSWRANQADVIGVLPLFEEIKEFPRKTEALGQYIREVVLEEMQKRGETPWTVEIKLPINEKVRERMLRDNSKARQILDKKIFVRFLNTATDFYQAPIYFQDAYYLKDESLPDQESNRVRIFEEVYSDDQSWRVVHMAIYNQATQILTKQLQAEKKLKQDLIWIDNEVFVSMPLAKKSQDLLHHINHSVFKPTIFEPDDVFYELLGFPEWMRSYIIKNGKISIVDYVALTYDFFTGVSLDEHTPKLESDIFPNARHRLDGFEDEGMRSTNGVLVEYWQAPEHRALIKQYAKALGLKKGFTDSEFFQALRERAELLKSFKAKLEAVKAVGVAELLIWLDTNQDPEKRHDWLEKTYESWRNKRFPGTAEIFIENAPRETMEAFSSAVRLAIQEKNPSLREKLWNQALEEYAFLIEALMESPIVSNVRRQVPYKGPDKWIEVLESLRGPQNREALQIFKKSISRVILGGRIFDPGAHKKFQHIKNLIRELGLENHFMTIENYNIDDAPTLFRGVSGTVMLSDEFLEASATSMEKGVVNGAALIGVWGGAMPELFTILDSSGKEINIFEQKVTHDQVVAKLQSGEWKIVNGFMVQYSDEMTNQKGGGRRPLGQSLKDSILWLFNRYQNANTRQDLQFEVIASTPKVNMRESQARAHALLWEKWLARKEREEKWISELRFSLEDAQKLFDSKAEKFVWWRNVSTPLDTSDPGIAGFVDAFRRLNINRTDDLLESLKHHASRGEIFAYLLGPKNSEGEYVHPKQGALKQFSENLEPLRQYLLDLAKRADQNVNLNEKIKINLQAIDALDLWIQWTSEKIFQGFWKSKPSELYKNAEFTKLGRIYQDLFYNVQVGKNVARYLETKHPEAQLLATVERGLQAFLLDAETDPAIFLLNTGAVSYPDKQGEKKAWGNIAYRGTFQAFIEKFLSEEGTALQLFDKIKGVEYGLYSAWELKENNGFMTGIPGVQVLGLKREKDEALIAAKPARSLSDWARVKPAVDQIIAFGQGRSQNGQKALEKILPPNRRVAEKIYPARLLPTLMGLVAGLAPIYLDRLENWDPEFYAVLKKIVTENADVMKRGHLSFAKPSREQGVFTFVYAVDGGKDGRDIIFHVEFNHDVVSYTDGKSWTVVRDLVSKDTLDLDPNSLYSIEGLVEGAYFNPKTGNHLARHWDIGVPVRAIYDEQGKTLQFPSGFGAYRVVPYQKEQFVTPESSIPAPEKIQKPEDLQIFEFNTRAYFEEIGIKSFDEFSEEKLKEIANQGFNTIYPMGIYQTSEASKALNLKYEDASRPGRRASAFAILDYKINNKDLGGEKGFLDLVRRAKKVGIRVIVDFIPNHLAKDTLLRYRHPDWFINRSTPPPANEKDFYFEDVLPNGKKVWFAYGKDGNPWADTIQFNLLNPEVWQYFKETLFELANLTQGGGVRADSLQVLFPEEYRQRWFSYMLPADFQNHMQAIARTVFGREPHEGNNVFGALFSSVKEAYPDFKILGEVYGFQHGSWQGAGVDLTTAKYIYDWIVKGEGNGNGEGWQEFKHYILRSPNTYYENIKLEYMLRSYYFLEDHDQRIRILEILRRRLQKPQIDNEVIAWSELLATAIATIPGVPLIYMGQPEGQSIYSSSADWYPSPHLLAQQAETRFDNLSHFYRERFRLTQLPVFRRGGAPEAVPYAGANGGTLAFVRRYEGSAAVVVLNHSREKVDIQLDLSLIGQDSKTVHLPAWGNFIDIMKDKKSNGSSRAEARSTGSGFSSEQAIAHRRTEVRQEALPADISQKIVQAYNPERIQAAMQFLKTGHDMGGGETLLKDFHDQLALSDLEAALDLLKAPPVRLPVPTARAESRAFAGAPSLLIEGLLNFSLSAEAAQAVVTVPVQTLLPEMRQEAQRDLYVDQYIANIRLGRNFEIFVGTHPNYENQWAQAIQKTSARTIQEAEEILKANPKAEWNYEVILRPDVETREALQNHLQGLEAFQSRAKIEYPESKIKIAVRILMHREQRKDAAWLKFFQFIDAHSNLVRRLETDNPAMLRRELLEFLKEHPRALIYGLSPEEIDLPKSDLARAVNSQIPFYAALPLIFEITSGLAKAQLQKADEIREQTLHLFRGSQQGMVIWDGTSLLITPDALHFIYQDFLAKSYIATMA